MRDLTYKQLQKQIKEGFPLQKDAASTEIILSHEKPVWFEALISGKYHIAARL